MENLRRADDAFIENLIADRFAESKSCYDSSALLKAVKPHIHSCMALQIGAGNAMEVKLSKLDGLREIESASVKLVEKWTGQPVDSQLTNHEGKATLRKMSFLPKNEYVLQIKHASGQWEIALTGKSLARKIV